MPWLQFHLTVDKSRAPLVELLFEADTVACETELLRILGQAP